MVKETNAVAGETSSSRRKRQRRPSLVQNEGENGRGTASVNGSIDGDEVIAEERWGTLHDLDLLDCPVCFHALTEHVFQCDNGHIACSSCCLILRYKCPTCALPIGQLRNRIMEKLVATVTVPCPNAKRGCTAKFSYGKELAHEKECSFSLCYCPAPNCNYSGVYKDLYSHYDANHHQDTLNRRFVYGVFHNPCLSATSQNNISVLQEHRAGPLVVVQCFEALDAMYVTVNCIAPPGVGKLSYGLTYSMGCHSTTFESENMNMIQRVSFQTPEDGFLSIPSYMNPPAIMQNLRICIRPLEEEEEASVEEEALEEGAVEEGAVEVEFVNSVRRSTRQKKTNSRYQKKVK